MKKILPVGTDFETIPSQDESIIEAINVKAKGVNVTPPSSYKKEDFGKDLELPAEAVKSMQAEGLRLMWIEKFRLREVEKEFDSLYRRTSFSAGDGGELISASFKLFGNNPDGSPLMPEPVSCYRAKGGDSESVVIGKMVSWLDKIHDYAKSNNSQIQFVGANIQMFDLRFLAQRCMILGLKLPDCGLLASRYDKTKYFDVLSSWNFDDSKSSISLDRLCKVLGIETPKDDEEGPIHGGMVWDIWNNGGEHGAARISRYNSRDVAVLEPIYNKLAPLYGESFYG